jgi:adenylosuccinate lyase
MKVWENKTEFKDNLMADKEIKKLLTPEEVDLICNLGNRLKNVNYVFKKLNLI